MIATAARLDDLVERVEQASVLDRVAEAVAGVWRRAVPPGPVRDALSGTPIGHPAHPLLVALPIGSWTSALVLDLTGADARTTRRLVGLGVLTALPTAATGAADWLDTAGAERRVGVVHAAANYGALMLQGASWLARRSGRRGSGAVLSVSAAALLGVGGWLGGHLSYALGVGVDTTAFQKLPADWADAGAESDVGAAPCMVEVGGVPVVLRRVDGDIVAMSDRCTHRGGPLHDGEVTADGCIVCPWHGSTFAPDGAVRAGPATRPAPALEVRVDNGRVQVRRQEQRSLRTNPVGH